MLIVSQERGDGFYAVHDPNIKLELNKRSCVAYFKLVKEDRIIAQYPTLQRGKDVFKKMLTQYKTEPNSIFRFPEQ